MRARHRVPLDPDGLSDGWLYVIVAARTGVWYRHQYGGTACRQGEAEGFLVPVAGADARGALRQLFERHFLGAGTWNHRWTDDEWARLGRIVGEVCYWTCDGDGEHPHALRLDGGRVSETDEAWVPVLTPDGRGTLVWDNSD